MKINISGIYQPAVGRTSSLREIDAVIATIRLPLLALFAWLGTDQTPTLVLRCSCAEAVPFYGRRASRFEVLLAASQIPHPLGCPVELRIAALRAELEQQGETS